LPDPEYEKVAPFSVSPFAGVKAKVAPVKSRDDELATMSTMNPDPVTPTIWTAVITGACGATVMVGLGFGLGKASGCCCPSMVSVSPVSATVTTPATLPSPTGTVAVRVFAGIVTVVVHVLVGSVGKLHVPVGFENPRPGSLYPLPAAFPENVSVSVAVTSEETGELRVRVTEEPAAMDVNAVTVGVMGTVGTPMVRENVIGAEVTFALSLTVTAKVNGLPCAVGVPLSTPVEAFNVRPVGRDPDTNIQLAYGGAPPPGISVWE
jgi:hypothetical protein